MPNNNKQNDQGRRDAPSTGQKGSYGDKGQNVGGSQQGRQGSNQPDQKSTGGGTQQKGSRSSGMNQDDDEM